ncbi:MAG TPA: hypothetical protein VFY56_05505 [Propionibacteriaceae bacterium]|nr:hypothetical protein [Propionibacteriaceae bacterium]
MRRLGFLDWHAVYALVITDDPNAPSNPDFWSLVIANVPMRRQTRTSGRL